MDVIHIIRRLGKKAGMGKEKKITAAKQMYCFRGGVCPKDILIGTLC